MLALPRAADVCGAHKSWGGGQTSVGISLGGVPRALQCLADPNNRAWFLRRWRTCVPVLCDDCNNRGWQMRRIVIWQGGVMAAWGTRRGGQDSEAELWHDRRHCNNASINCQRQRRQRQQWEGKGVHQEDDARVHGWENWAEDWRRRCLHCPHNRPVHPGRFCQRCCHGREGEPMLTFSLVFFCLPKGPWDCCRKKGPLKVRNDTFHLRINWMKRIFL